MSRSIVCALALSALVLSPALATAKGGGGGGSVSKGGSAPAARQQHTDSKPQVSFTKMKVMRCGKYGRGDGQGGTVMVTVCN